MLPDNPKEVYAVLGMAREIIDVWWGGDPEIERDRAQRHHIDLEGYGQARGAAALRRTGGTAAWRDGTEALRRIVEDGLASD